MSTKQTTLPKGHKKDLHGNVEGTVYSEQGIAMHPTYADELLTNRPVAAEGQTAIVYNEDGSVFAPPADAPAKILTLKADIQGIKIACEKSEQKIASATEMMNEADDSDKPIFEKNINSQKIALESNRVKQKELETSLHETILSLITPGQRAIERELASALEQKATLQIRIDELLNKKKAFTGAGIQKDNQPAPTATPASEEQTKNKEALIKQHGTQGKAIAALVKAGWTNTEIYKHMGIPPASVPGPKNAWLNSADGAAYAVDKEGRAKLK